MHYCLSDQTTLPDGRVLVPEYCTENVWVLAKKVFQNNYYYMCQLFSQKWLQVNPSNKYLKDKCYNLICLMDILSIQLMLFHEMLL